jgi:hypothetical protein
VVAAPRAALAPRGAATERSDWAFGARVVLTGVVGFFDKVRLEK